VSIDPIYRQRTRELFTTTRSEVMSSIGAALFFAGVVAWRFAPEHDRLALYGCAAVVVWAAGTALRFRSSLRRRAPAADALAATGLEHYRSELTRRRDHLRSAWIWHGPLLLAMMVAVGAGARRSVPGRLWDALPLLILLAIWAAIGIRRRRRAAAALQQEIDELTRASGIDG
jgi:hypothetical protein